LNHSVLRGAQAPTPHAGTFVHRSRYCDWVRTFPWDYVCNGYFVHTQDHVWMNMAQRWNGIDRGNRKRRRKTCPHVTLSTTNSTWADLGTNRGLCYWYFLTHPLHEVTRKVSNTEISGVCVSLSLSLSLSLRRCVCWHVLLAKPLHRNGRICASAVNRIAGKISFQSASLHSNLYPTWSLKRIFKKFKKWLIIGNLRRPTYNTQAYLWPKAMVLNRSAAILCQVRRKAYSTRRAV
jgi:hypothetical protein